MSPLIQRFEAMLAGGRDDKLLRFGLGQAYLKEGDPGSAARHLEHAVAQDEGYSAAWKLLGQAYTALQDEERAISAFRRGIAVAGERGDRQAAREMQVFLRRLEKRREG